MSPTTVGTSATFVSRHPIFTFAILPLFALLLVLGGIAYWAISGCALGEGESAVTTCSQIVDVLDSAGANSDWWVWRRGVAYAMVQQNAAAISDFDRAIRDNPKNAAAYTARGTSRMAEHDFRHALDDFNIALQLDPNPETSANLEERCRVRTALNTQLEQALADCNRALGIWRSGKCLFGCGFEPASLLLARGFVYFRQARFEEADRDFDAALRWNPNLAAALYARGLAEARLGDKAHSESDLVKARARWHSIGNDLAPFVGQQ